MTIAESPRETARIDALDVIRGISVFGILFMNILLMGRAVNGEFYGVYPDWSSADQAAFVLRSLFLEGTMRGLFSLLFGASFVLLMAKASTAEGTLRSLDRYFRRSVWLGVIGLVHATLLLWPGEILFDYALASLLLPAFRSVRPARLLSIAALLLVALNVLQAAPELYGAHIAREAAAISERQAGGHVPTADDLATIERWERIAAKGEISYVDVDHEISQRQSYVTSVPYLVGVWLNWHNVFAYWWYLESFSFFLIGMALFKLGILQGSKPRSFYWRLMIAGYAAGLAVNGFETWVQISTGDGPTVWADDMTMQFGRLAMTLGHLALIHLALKSRWVGWLMAFQPAGRMALSNYIGQSVACGVLFTGFGLFGRFNNLELWGIAAGICILQFAFSHVWMAGFTMGPLEWAWRSLTYWRAQPLVRHAARGPALDAI